MRQVRTILDRLRNSAVAWSWAFNGLRLAYGLLLIPLLVRQLTTEDLGMYFVFTSLSALVPIVDFGFSAAFGRFVSYAMAGATTLQATGLVASPPVNSGPNFSLLRQLLATTRKLYGCLALVAFLVVGAWGTYLVATKAAETFSPRHTWWAWGLTLVAAIYDVYSIWWNTFLHCMDRVVPAARIGLMAFAVRMILACGFLMLGWGLLSVPLAMIFSALLNRTLSRRACLQFLGEPPPGGSEERSPSLFPLLWPNSWRLGVQFVSSYLKTNLLTQICAMAFDLKTTAKYGLSMQVFSICLGMANVWIYVKWPAVGQYRTRQDFAGLQRMLWPRLWLQTVTFAVLVVLAIASAPWLLEWIAPDKNLLPLSWLALLAVNTFLEMQFNVWGTIISTENRLPYLWPSVAGNLLSLGLCLVLVSFSSLGVGALVVGPLLVGIIFNYWYWPLAGARSIKTRLFPYLFARKTA